MNALRWKPLLCGCGIILLALLFFHQLAFSGKILARGDTFKYFYPYWDARNEAFRAGELPLWSPDLLMGLPLLANPQLGAYYPLNWLTAPFRAPTAISLSIMLHVALAAAGVCALYRQAISKRWLPGLVAGTVYAFGGYLGAHVEQINQLQGLAWMPILFALYHRLLKSERPWRLGLLLAMAWSLQIFSGHTQTVFISGIGLALYGILFKAGAQQNGLGFIPARIRRALLLLTASFAVALLLALPQLLPSLELSSLSNRSSGFSAQEATAFSLPPSVLGRALLPSYDGQLFGEFVTTLGIIGLGLALWGIASPAFSIQKRRIWLLLALVGLALAFGRYNPLYLLLANLPGFNLFRVPARFLALFSLAMALLAGMGFESLHIAAAQPPGRWRRILPIAIFIALLIAVTRFVLQPDGSLLFGGPAISDGSLLIWVVSALLLIGLLIPRHRWTQIAAAVLLALELFLASVNLPYNDLSPPDVYLGQRETVRELLASQAQEKAPSRLIAISPLLFDPLDIIDLRARYDRLSLDYKAQFHALDAIKMQEMMMPNLPLTWSIPSIDGFGGGITPSRYYSLYSSLLLPPDALPAVDGRLGERLTLRSCRAACIPPLRWLEATDTRTVITDKVFDFWQDDIFYDTALWNFWNGVTELAQPPDSAYDRVGVVHRQPLNIDAPDIPVQEGFSLTVMDMADLPDILRQQPGIVAVTAINSNAPGSFQEIQPPPFERVFSGAVKVFRLPPSGKRAYLAADTGIVADDHAGDLEALRLLREGEVDVIHGAAVARSMTPDDTGRVDILDYSDMRVSLAVSAPNAAYLILSDAWYPGWRATVNGGPAPIQRANLIFRALPVPAGDSSVVFSFEPGLWRAALYIGCVLWLITLLAALRPAWMQAAYRSVVSTSVPHLWSAALYIGRALWLITLRLVTLPPNLMLAVYRRYRLKPRRLARRALHWPRPMVDYTAGGVQTRPDAYRHKLTPLQTKEKQTMKLGTYVEILNYVDDTAAAGAYYQKLGLVPLGDDVYTDGRYHLHLLAGDGQNPTLRYFGCDLDALRGGGLDIVDDSLTSPAGIRILLSSDPPPRQLPHDNVAKAQDITRLGKFGELSAFIPDIQVECAFWEAAGYEVLGKYEQPMPWGIWLDQLFLIGLHQEDVDEPFAICHFAPDMKAVNADLLAEGFDLNPFDTSGDAADLTYQKLMTPYGIMFYLFTGDISEAQP